MKNRNIINTLVGVVSLAAIIVVLSGCPNAGTSSDDAGGVPSDETPGSTVGDALGGLNLDTKATIPESLLNAQSSESVSGSEIQALAEVVDTTGEVGVFGRTMWDLMYNHLIDLATEGVNTDSVGRTFLTFLQDIASDPNISLTYDTDIDIGVRTLPAGTQGPSGESELDLGTLKMTELSATETQISWTIPFDSIDPWPDGGVYYVRLNLDQKNADTLEVVTRMGFLPNNPDGSPGDEMVDPHYDKFDTNGSVFSYYWSDDEAQIFQQYTDENGMIRTMFNGAIGGDSPYDLLFLMIGDDTQAGIYSYQKTVAHGVSFSFEAYNSDGYLMNQINYLDTGDYYKYPIKYLTKSGYTLTKNVAGDNYWLDNDTNGTTNEYDTADIDLPSVSLVDSSAGAGGSSPGYYVTWVSGKNFEAQDILLCEGNTAISGLDSEAFISGVDTALSDWVAAIGDIDIDGGDIISFPDTEADFMAAQGFPLDPTEFPAP